MRPANPHIQAQITDYWNFRSASYDAEPHHTIHDGNERAAWEADLQPLLPPPPADVLDVGAGTGFLSILLAELGYRVIGIDPAEQMLAAARRKSGHLSTPPRFQVGDAHALPYPAASFDAVTSRHLLWTLHDPATAFAEWLRVLRPGGLVVAIDSLWFLDEHTTDREREPPVYAEAWARHRAALEHAGMPLLRAHSMEPAAELLRSGGFTEVRIARLASVERLDERLAHDATRRRLPRYAVTGVRSVAQAQGSS